MKLDPVLPVCWGVVGLMRESLIHWVMLKTDGSNVPFSPISEQVRVG